MTSFIDDNGNELDYDGKDFGITKQTISFVDFRIKGDVSVNFSIPNTAKNRAKLGYQGTNQLNTPAFSRLPFSIIRNGQKLNKGYLVIQKHDTDDKKLECYFISGNSNWFNKLQFNCNEVENPIYSISWDIGINYSAAHANRNNKHGIVFPYIDFAFEGKYAIPFLDYSWPSDTFDGSVSITPKRYSNLFPCLYIHTLIEEIARRAQVNISGNLINDGLYNSLILTSDGPEIFDSDGNEIIRRNTNSGNSAATFNPPAGVITIGSMAPKLKAIELIKYLCFSFGCIPVYDVESNTLELNKTTQITSTEDWSPYLKSFDYDYSRVKQYYYFKNKQQSDKDTIGYNQSNVVDFGDLRHETDKDDGGETTAYQSPFGSSRGYVHQENTFRPFGAYVDFFTIEDKETFTYSSVSGTSGNPRLGGISPAIATDQDQQVGMAEIVDNNRTYGGYVYCTCLAATNEIVLNDLTFIRSSSGKITFKSFTPKKTFPRVLLCKTDVNFSDFTGKTTVEYVPFSGSITATTCSIAWCVKQDSIYPVVNGYNKDLAYGDVNLSTYNSITLKDSSLTVVLNMISSPPVKAKMILPESVFMKYNFDRWIYINDGELNGEFFVHSIENYVSADKEVTVNLLRVK